MTTSKKISPGAYPALQEALASIYHFKTDLRNFLRGALPNSLELLRDIDWEDKSNYKIRIVGQVVGRLREDEPRYQSDAINLMSQVVEFQSFPHLARLEDGDAKVERAQAAVAALREWITPHSELVAEQKAVEARTKKQREIDLGNQAFQNSLQSIKLSFYNLHSRQGDEQKRGIILESVLSEMFALFDLDPRRSFKIRGEQIDGAFTYDSTDYIVEARWTKDLIQPKDLRDFQGKVSEKLDNTLGVFVSINGYTDNAVTLHLGTRPNVILFAGADLNAVLEGRIDLVYLLLRKRRHASQTGEIYLPVDQIILED